MIDVCSLEPKPLLTIEEALASIKSTICPVTDSERIPLKEALGRVLSNDVNSNINLPTDRNSAMDGYALSSKDIDQNHPFTLDLVGTAWAGKPYKGSLQPGQCIRILTGAVVPESLDSVVIQEQVRVDDGKINFPADVTAYQNIRAAGEDIKAGGFLCPSNKKLAPSDIGLLAAAGVVEVAVLRKLKIAYFSTGDELISLGKELETGQIYDSNRYTLSGLLVDPGHIIVDLGIIPDNRHMIEQALKGASHNYDVIISTGGASVGDADFIKETLAKIGQVNFWKIAIKPGKPLAFGKIGASYFFGLPGNPAAVMVTFQQIIVPALRQLCGLVNHKPLRILAICSSTLKKALGRQEYLRGILSQDEHGNFFVASAGGQGSHILSSMSRSNCYIVLPIESKGVLNGEQVWVEPFSFSF